MEAVPSAMNSHTPFEKFLLASTPFVAQVLENDTLLTIFNSLEEISDVGVEVYYVDPEDSTPMWDIFLPTLKGISWAYKSNLLSDQIQTYTFNEEAALYQRVPFVDKLQELSEERSDLFETPIIWISSTSWIAIEWFLHYSSKMKHGVQKSITVYYCLDFKRYSSYLPVINWQVNDLNNKLVDMYQICPYPYPVYQPYDVNSLAYK